MNFRLSVDSLNYPFTLNQRDHLISMGSCFAEHIGRRLHERRFSLVRNPFGTLYHPLAIGNALQMLLDNYQFAESDFVQQHELWHSYHHHGQFSHPDLTTAITQIQTEITRARTQLLRANRLLLTLGTAQVYTLKPAGKVVANCHKLPAQQFTKRRLSVAETVEGLRGVLTKLKLRNSDFQCIVTVSPVRHWRDGLVENQRSKAVLLLAVAELIQQLDYVHYFPAYEFVIDDLRDYRFYEKDLAHPNTWAQDYVWEQFAAAFFDKKTQHLNQRIEKLLAAQQHRPLHPTTNAHQRFRQQQLTKAQALQREYPYLDFSDLIDFFSES